MPITALAYSKDTTEELSLKQLEKGITKGKKLWIDLCNCSDTEVKRVADLFGLHHLAIEDCLNWQHRAKLDNYGDYLFLIAKGFLVNKKIETNQLSLFLGKNFVISVRRSEPDLSQVIERLRSGKTKLHGATSSFLFYTIIDEITDNYFPGLEKLQEEVEVLEDRAMNDSSKKTLNDLFIFKRQLFELEKSLWPMESALQHLMKGDTNLIEEHTLPYLKDASDQVIRVLEIIEMHREGIDRATEGYLLANANSTNDIMKNLTVVMAILLFPNLIAAFLSMNIPGIPSINFWVMSAGLVALMFALYIWFKTTKWI